MMTGVRNLLWAIPLGLLLAWPGYGPPLSRFLAPRGDFAAAPALAVEAGKRFVMEEVLFVQEMNGQPDWRIKTKRLATGATDDQLEMDTVRATLYRNHQENMLIGASAGLYDTKKEVLALRDNVDITTADGYVIRTAFLEYFEADRKIATRSPIRVTGKDLDIHGNGLDYDLKNGAYVLGGRVRFTTW